MVWAPLVALGLPLVVHKEILFLLESGHSVSSCIQWPAERSKPCCCCNYIVHAIKYIWIYIYKYISLHTVNTIYEQENNVCNEKKILHTQTQGFFKHTVFTIITCHNVLLCFQVCGWKYNFVSSFTFDHKYALAYATNHRGHVVPAAGMRLSTVF